MLAPPGRFWERLELVLPLLLVVLHGPLYNQIGNLAASRGLDFGPVVVTGLDEQVPFLPLMVFPYMIAWLFPALLMVALVRSGLDRLAVRKIVAAIVVLEVVCYLLWVAFPVKCSLRLDETALAEHGWPGWLVLENYKLATVWNACPSFHIAGSWLFLRAAQLYRVRFLSLFFVLYLLIAISTVTIRIHYLADILVGLLVSEAVFRFTLRRFDPRGTFENYSTGKTITIYVALLATGTTVWALLALLTN